MDIRKLLAFGAGFGIEIRGEDLEIAVARVRPSGAEVLGRATIARFRERPASEWGSECSRLLKACGASHLSATVLLPRSDVIVRHIALPGVARKDYAPAIALQLETLQPYGEDAVVYGWSPVGTDAAVIGILRRDTLEEYASMFTEAGIAVSSFTFSAAAVHSAIRILAAPPAGGFLAFSPGEDGTVEIYGESEARPIFTAEFDLPPERASALAMAELRLAPDAVPFPLHELLPKPKESQVKNDLSRNALPYAAALAGACPRLAPAANLLPPERRSSRSRAMFVPTAVLAVLLVLVAGALMARSGYQNRRYLELLESQIAALEPQARKAAALDRQIDTARDRSRMLDEFRGRTRADLDSLNELTRLLPPPIWSNNIELTRDAVTINGEAEQAAALLSVLDNSPLFRNSEFSSLTRFGKNEIFRIRTIREVRK